MERHGIGMYFVNESEMLRAFVATVERYLPHGSRLLEVGYGPGTLGIYLSRYGYKVLCVDMDQDVIELGKHTNKRLGGAADFKVCDLFAIDRIFGPDNFDAVISCVTLEHFSDQDIVEAVRKQLIVANINIFAVHCSNVRPDVIPHLDGGERLLEPSYWKGLIRKAGGIVIDRFGYGFKYGRMGGWNWRIHTVVESVFFRKFARFAANTGFVVGRAER